MTTATIGIEIGKTGFTGSALTAEASLSRGIGSTSSTDPIDTEAAAVCRRYGGLVRQPPLSARLTDMGLTPD